jgi:protein gp37
MSVCPQHTFFFLTKNPSAWQKWGTWPDNAFVGATVDDWDAFHHNVNKLCFTKAKNKWLSLEPCPPPLGDKADRQLLGKILKAAGINWIVIGGYSGGKRLPPMQALIDVVNIADSAGIPIWIKDNLRGYDVETMIKPLRHQFPEVLSDSCNWDDPTMMMMNNFSLNL